MLSQLPRNTWQVLGRPCEDAPILTEEVDELAFLFRVHARTDVDDMLGIIIELDRLCVLGRLERGISLCLAEVLQTESSGLR